ncbi:Alpha/Beta hydrolase protein [Xylariaceae sp. FL1019]|nr:Alpha/Beta hydrolase protein [Xylariaceae sp. FL1019]
MPFVTLPSKPEAPIAYEIFPGSAESTLLIVCLNGLAAPQTVWKPVIQLFQQQQSKFLVPWILTYDRYGQGASPRDPREKWVDKEPGYAHTVDDVVDDLHELIKVVAPERCRRLVFVNNSIGAHVARRFADRYPKIIEGILFLDSNPGNTDYSIMWPNPFNQSFDLATMVPPGTSLDVYKTAYNNMTSIFAPECKNKEGFDRRGIKTLLPDPSRPMLKGSKKSGKGPWVTVVGHDVERFEREEWENPAMRVPLGMARMWTQPVWDEYNRGLCGLTDPERAKGPLVAPGAGHVIQRDNPEFVARELVELVGKVESERDG